MCLLVLGVNLDTISFLTNHECRNISFLIYDNVEFDIVQDKLSIAHTKKRLWAIESGIKKEELHIKC